MDIKKISKYMQCQDCKYSFILPKATYDAITNPKSKLTNPVLCIRCHSSNVAHIDRKTYKSNYNKKIVRSV